MSALNWTKCDGEHCTTIYRRPVYDLPMSWASVHRFVVERDEETGETRIEQVWRHLCPACVRKRTRVVDQVGGYTVVPE